MKEIFRLHLIACLFSCSLFSQNITIDAPKIILKDMGFGLVFSGEFDGDTDYLLSINGQNFKPDQITSEKLFFDKIKIGSPPLCGQNIDLFRLLLYHNQNA